jgi:hypothetical protein
MASDPFIARCEGGLAPGQERVRRLFLPVFLAVTGKIQFMTYGSEVITQEMSSGWTRRRFDWKHWAPTLRSMMNPRSLFNASRIAGSRSSPSTTSRLAGRLIEQNCVLSIAARSARFQIGGRPQNERSPVGYGNNGQRRSGFRLEWWSWVYPLQTRASKGR